MHQEEGGIMSSPATSVSLTPTTASGVLCRTVPIAAALSAGTTITDMRALAEAVRLRQHTTESLSSWTNEMYGQDTVDVSVSGMERVNLADGAPLSSEQDPLVALPAHAPTLSAITPAQPQASSGTPPPPKTELTTTAAASGTGSSHSSVSGDVSTMSAAVAATSTVSAPGSYRPRNHISWRCTLCGYHVLAIDQDGIPLPFATSAFGNVLPMTCPRCKLSHTSWLPSTPFNKEGDHVNLPTTLSNRYVMPTSTQRPTRPHDRPDSNTPDQPVTTGTGTESFLAGHALAQRATMMASIAAEQYSAPRPSINTVSQRRAYYCGRCGRRLLRVDANGELVDMDRDADGDVLPITCPGCHENHSEWVVKPYAVRR